MEKLEACRKKYLENSEAKCFAERAEELAKIERELSKLDLEKCRDYYINLYTTTGTFQTTHLPNVCSTNRTRLKYPDDIKKEGEKSDKFRIVETRRLHLPGYFAEISPSSLIENERMDWK